MAPTPYAELHCHTNFSFLDGASAPDDLVERAVELGLTGLAVTDHAGPLRRGPLRRRGRGGGPAPGHRDRDRAARRGRRRIPTGWSIAGPRRPRRRGGRHADGPGRGTTGLAASRACPHRPRPERARLPGHREAVKEDLRGIGERSAARTSCCSPATRSAIGACAGSSPARTWPGRRACRASRQALLAEHTEGLVALSGCRDGEIARRLRVGDRAGARAVARALRRAVRARRRPGRQRLLHRAVAPPACPTTTGSWRSRRRWPRSSGLPVVVDQRRPLRPARGPRAGRRPDRDPPRPDARDARPTCAAPTASRT